MKKVAHNITNAFCPQALFLYGTYKADGTPNFGLFCWFSYCLDKELQVMACIGGDKLTKDRIREKHVFSANLVTEKLLPLADFYGNNEGYKGEKARIQANTVKGSTLDVPVLEDSPWSYELEVVRTIPLDDSEVYLCAIRGITVAEELKDETLSVEERMRIAAPVLSSAGMNYFRVDPQPLGAWGTWKDMEEA